MRLKTLLILAVLIGVPAFLLLARPEPLTPRQDLARLRSSIASERPDEQHTLRQLSRLLRDAREDGDRALVEEVIDTRAAYLRKIGAPETAKRDLEELLADFRQGDPNVRLRLALAEVDSGEEVAGLELLNALVREAPEFLSARVELGVIEQRRAGERLAEAEAITRAMLIESDHEQVVGLLRELAAKDPNDRSRTATTFAIRGFFRPADESDLARALSLADEASRELSVARQAFASSFELGLDRRAVTGFLRILVDAGEVDLAVDTGRLGLESPSLRENDETVLLLIDVLLERGDVLGAARIAKLSLDSSETHEASHLRKLCLALYRGESRGPMITAAVRLRGIARGDDAEVAEMYMGFGMSQGAAPRRAENFLRDFATSQTEEPFRGARAEAWFTLAKLARDRGDDAIERESLLGALALQPDGHGAEWLRLAELQETAPHGGYRAPLESYTRGMCQVPRFASQLMDKWIELGDRVLYAGGRDLDTIQRNLRRRGQFYPVGDVDPYLYYRLAERSLDDGSPTPAATIVRRLLEEYPDLLPAVDLMIRVTAAQGRKQEHLEWIVRRLELAGPDDVGRELLSSVDPEEWSGEQRVRLMAADPSGAGRLEVARSLIDSGRDQEALIALRAPTQRETDEERVAEARILYRHGQFQDALNVIALLEPSSPQALASLRENVLGSLYVSRIARVRVLLAEVLEAQGEERSTRLLISDLYARIGDAAEALRVLESDYAGPGADWELLRRYAVANLMLAEQQRGMEEAEPYYRAALAAIDRAEGLSDDPAIAVGRLLVAYSRGDVPQQDLATRELSSYDVDAPPLWRGLAAAAAGSWTEASGIVDAAADGVTFSDPDQCVWGLLRVLVNHETGQPAPLPPTFGKTGSEMFGFWRGVAGDRRDESRSGALLLAAETPGFELYTLAGLQARGGGAVGKLWRVLLEARTLQRMGELWQARARALDLVEAFPEFQPGWTLLERVEIERLGRDHPGVDQVLRMREVAENPALARAERALGEVRAKYESGDYDAATTQLRALLEAAPDWVEARVMLAETHQAAGRLAPAAEVWEELTTYRPQTVGRDYVTRYVDCLFEMRDDPRGQYDDGYVGAALNRLHGLFPSDPTVVLALARIDLHQDPDNVSICVSRALKRLQDYRDGLRGRSLESVRAGTLAEWIEFYAQLDPDLAERVLREERAADPGQPDAWRLMGRLLRRTGDLARSREELRLFAEMLPDATTHLELAETSIRLGLPHGVIARHLREAQRLGAELQTMYARALTAESQLSHGQPALVDAAIQTLSELWEERGRVTRDERSRLAYLYGRALLSRARKADKDLARVVLTEGLRATSDPYRAATMRALHGIAGLADSRPVDASADAGGAAVEGTEANAGDRSAARERRAAQAADGANRD